MIFIDESFKEIYVMGAVVGLQHEVEDTIHAARAYIKKNNRNCPKKIILPEIKDSEIHREHPQIKQMVLENLIKIMSMKGKIRENISIYSVFLESKDVCKISQTTAYKILSMELIRRIVSSYEENQNCFNFDVYFDRYGEHFFRQKLYQDLYKEFPGKKLSLTHVSSEKVKAIQTEDVVTGSIRRYLTGEDTKSLKIFSQNLRVMERVEIK